MLLPVWPNLNLWNQTMVVVDSWLDDVLTKKEWRLVDICTTQILLQEAIAEDMAPRHHRQAHEKRGEIEKSPPPSAVKARISPLLCRGKLRPVWPGLNFWYYLAIISSPSWVFSFLAMDFIKKTTGLIFIFLISTLAISCFASNFVLSKFYFSLRRNQEADLLFRGYERAGKTIGYALLFFGNVGLYYFSEKSVACMLTFLFLAFYCLCTLFCIQPHTDFGALEFLLGACMNQTLSLSGLRSSHSWLVIIPCIVIAGTRFCLEPVHPSRSEATTGEVDLEEPVHPSREATTDEVDPESGRWNALRREVSLSQLKKNLVESLLKVQRLALKSTNL